MRHHSPLRVRGPKLAPQSRSISELGALIALPPETTHMAAKTARLAMTIKRVAGNLLSDNLSLSKLALSKLTL